MKHAVKLMIVIIALPLYAGAKDGDISPERIATELKYAEELRKIDLDDFADKVISDLPEINTKPVILARFQSFMHRNMKDEKKIEKYIKKQAGDDAELYWILKIRHADAFWSCGKKDKCLKIYEDFMKYYEKETKKEKKTSTTKSVEQTS